MQTLFLFLLLSQPTPPAPEVVEQIQFPAIVVPAPPPAPAPMAVSKLTGQQLYVISSNIPCFVLDSPTGLVRITEEAGPIKLRGIFVDGNGKVETRTYKTKQVFLVEAVGTGTCELLVVTVGKTSAKDVIRKALDVDAGLGPLPPPVPPGPIPPTPGPVPIPGDGFRVMIVEDKAKLSLMPPAQLAVRTSKAVRDYLDAKCVTEPDGRTKGYRIWDKETPSAGDLPVWQNALTRPRATLPWIIISNGKSGYEGPLPADVTKTLELLKKYGE